ncbi:hypothetical protein CR513_56197, partial [Mucuna pruriens]
MFAYPRACLLQLANGNQDANQVATKWNPTLNGASNEFTMINSMKLLEDKKIVGDERSINKLEAEQNSVKKNVEQLLQNLKEENILWKRRERQKIKATLKGELERERRSRERMELLNIKLVHEVGEANLLAKKFMANYDKGVLN